MSDIGTFPESHPDLHFLQICCNTTSKSTSVSQLVSLFKMLYDESVTDYYKAMNDMRQYCSI
jgi:hypothetical protein